MKKYYFLLTLGMLVLTAILFPQTSYGQETGLLKFINASGTVVLNYPAGQTIYLRLTDSDRNLNPAAIDQVNVLIASQTEVAGETVVLTETLANSGIFSGSINTQLAATVANDGLLQVAKGDKLTASYNDPADDFGNPKLITALAFYDVTLLSGVINAHTTWTKANSPYLITGDVTVNENVSLNIQPGVEVRIVPLSDDKNSGNDVNRSELIIKGSLIANGLPNDSIRFLSNSENPASGDWYGIRVLESSSFCNLSFNTIQHASSILYFESYYGSNDTIQITNNHFRQSGNGIYSGWYNQNFKIENNAFSNLSQSAIFIYSTSKNINIHHNDFDQIGYGIYLGSHKNRSIKNSITNNNISNVNDYGIHASQASFDEISNNLIHYSSNGLITENVTGKILGNNIQYATNLGMHLNRSNILAENNLIKYNAYGIHVSTDFENPVTDTLRYNTITNNNIRGILNENYAKTVAHYNNIHDNGGYGQFDFENYSAFDIDARFNFWGDFSTNQMQTGANPKNISKIKDQYDDNNLGFVNYGQWLPCEGCPPGAITETGKLSLTNASGVIVLNYPAGQTIYLRLNDSDRNLNPAAIDQVNVLIASQTEVDGETITLTETGLNSGIFTGSINTQAAAAIANDGLLQVSKGDKLTATWNDPADDFGNPAIINAFAFYDVTLLSGVIDTHTTWTKANSPYLITGDVTVNQNVSLTIQPGVEVRIVPLSDDQNAGTDPNRSELIIKGSLIANGLPNDSIRFLSNSENPASGDWYGISVLESSSFCNLSFNTIQHASSVLYFYSYNGSNDTIQITNNHFRQSGNGIYSGWYNQNFKIENNAFSNLSQSAIFIYSTSKNINIHHNDFDQIGYGIYLGSHKNRSIKNSITNNNISNVNDYGIHASQASFDEISNNLIHYSSNGLITENVTGKILGNNIQYATNLGMHLNRSNILAENNLIKYNAYGIHVSTDFENPVTDTLRYNTITNNNIRGILNENYAKTVAHYNNIHDNGGYGQFDFENYSAFDIDARFNFWGDFTTNQMQTGANPKNISKIKDQYDDNNLGFVNYGQWATTSIGALSSEAELMTFALGQQAGPAVINAANRTIAVSVNPQTSITALTACWTISENASISVAGIPQLCNVTTNDYTNPVVFRVTAEDGISFKDWTVNVTVLSNCQPNWVPLDNFQYNLQVVAQILINGQVSLNPNDVLGAFVGEECRGIASPQANAGGLVFLTVGSDVASGEQVELKIWNSTDCSECNAIPGFEFVNQAEVGTFLEPYQVRCGAILDLSFGQGYTWFSLNVNPGSMSPASLFTGLTPCYDDRVIGQTSFALYTGSSWLGSLTTLSMDKMYRMKLCSAQNLSLMGDAAALNPINLNAGYTWLGYHPQECQSVSAAMAGLSPGPSYNDRVIGQSSFALYTGTAWIGSLTQLCPGKGYIVKLANAQSLTYPASTSKGSPVVEAETNSPTGVYPVENMQHTMMVMAQLRLPDGSISLNEKDVVYALIDGVVMGMATPDAGTEGMIFLSVGSDTETAQPITFMVWLDEKQELVPLNETFSFEPLAAVGELINPFILTLGEMVDLDEKTNGIWIGEPYPNPFSEQTTIPYFLNEAAELQFSVYDSRGVQVRPNEIMKAESGRHQFNVEFGGLAKGIYLLKTGLTTKNRTYIKLIKLAYK